MFERKNHKYTRGNYFVFSYELCLSSVEICSFRISAVEDEKKSLLPTKLASRDDSSYESQRIPDKRQSPLILRCKLEDPSHPDALPTQVNEDVTTEIQTWMIRAVRALKRDAFRGAWRDNWHKGRMQETVSRLEKGTLKKLCSVFLKMEHEMS
jgi:hypothetical protein